MKESHRGPLRNACLMVGGKSNRSIKDSADVTDRKETEGV